MEISPDVVVEKLQMIVNDIIMASTSKFSKMEKDIVYEPFEVDNQDHKENYSNDFLQLLHQQYKEGILTDYVIKIADEKEIKCHKCVLFAKCQFFKTMLTCQFEDSKADFVNLEYMDGECLEAVINYLYTGKIKVEWSKIEDVVEIANFLGVEDLLHSCDFFIRWRVCSENVDHWYKIARSRNLTDVKRYIETEHIAELCLSDEYRGLPFEEVKEILKNEVLNTAEQIVLNAALAWWVSGKNYTSDPEGTVFDCVRFDLIKEKIYESLRASFSDEMFSYLPVKFRKHVWPDRDNTDTKSPVETAKVKSSTDTSDGDMMANANALDNNCENIVAADNEGDQKTLNEPQQEVKEDMNEVRIELNKQQPALELNETASGEDNNNVDDGEKPSASGLSPRSSEDQPMQVDGDQVEDNNKDQFQPGNEEVQAPGDDLRAQDPQPQHQGNNLQVQNNEAVEPIAEAQGNELETSQAQETTDTVEESKRRRKRLDRRLPERKRFRMMDCKGEKERIWYVGMKKNAWKEVTMVPYRVIGGTMCLTYRGIIVCGGRKQHDADLCYWEPGEISDACEVFNIDTFEWSTMPNMISKRIDHKCVVVSGKMYVIGGKRKVKCKSEDRDSEDEDEGEQEDEFKYEDHQCEVLCLDLHNLNWTVMAQCPDNLNVKSILALNNEIFVISSKGSESQDHYFHKYDIERNAWIPMPKPPGRYYDQVQMVLHNGEQIYMACTKENHRIYVHRYNFESSSWDENVKTDFFHVVDGDEDIDIGRRKVEVEISTIHNLLFYSRPMYNEGDWDQEDDQLRTCYMYDVDANKWKKASKKFNQVPVDKRCPLQNLHTIMLAPPADFYILGPEEEEVGEQQGQGDGQQAG